MNARRLALALFYGLIAATTMSCGQLTMTPPVRLAPDGAAPGYSSSNPFNPWAEDGDFSCPADRANNISPDFMICPSTRTTASVLIHGQTRVSDTICVFPTRYVDEDREVYKADLTGAPMYRCAKVADGGVIATFELTNYNAAYIVERPARDQMLYCLQTHNPRICPPNSHGRFR